MRRSGCRSRGKSSCSADPSFGPGSHDVVLESAMPLSPSNLPDRHADRASRVRQRRQTVGPAAHRRQGQDRGAADGAAGPHGVRAGRRGFAVAGAAQARRRGRVQPGAAAGQRARARLRQLRQPVLQHRRPRRPLPRERPRPRGAGGRGRQGARRRSASRPRRARDSRPRTPSPWSRAASDEVADPQRARGRAGSMARATTPTACRCCIALAKHFGKPANRPDRTLVFVASAGHHSPGMNGPRELRRWPTPISPSGRSSCSTSSTWRSATSRRRGRPPPTATARPSPIPARRRSCRHLERRRRSSTACSQQGVTRYGVNFISTTSEHGKRRDRRVLRA